MTTPGPPRGAAARRIDDGRAVAGQRAVRIRCQCVGDGCGRGLAFARPAEVLLGPPLRAGPSEVDRLVLRDEARAGDAPRLIARGGEGDFTGKRDCRSRRTVEGLPVQRTVQQVSAVQGHGFVGMTGRSIPAAEARQTLSRARGLSRRSVRSRPPVARRGGCSWQNRPRPQCAPTPAREESGETLHLPSEPCYLSNGSRGRPRMRSAMVLRVISDVPPAMVIARLPR